MLDPTQRRITSVFKNAPPLPFETLKVHLFTAAASQSTPAHCDGYNARRAHPWSERAGRTPPTDHGSTNPEEASTSPPVPRAPCPGKTFRRPAVPSRLESTQRGLHPFTVTIERPDASRRWSRSRPSTTASRCWRRDPCPSTQKRAPPRSEIGESRSSPAWRRRGHAPRQGLPHGPYKGAPFGLLAVTPNQFAGPFYLTEIPAVRSTIEVDEHTAAATITEHSIPSS